VPYNSLRSWKVIATITLISTFVVLGIYYLHPSNLYWHDSKDFSFINLLQFVVIDQYLIELVTASIISVILGKYAALFKFQTLELTFQGVCLYFLKFVPFFFTVYFFTTPFTVGIRYLYHYFISQKNQTDYFASYFFININLYLSYLLPIIIMSSLFLTVAILKAISRSKKITTKNGFATVSLTVKSEIGEKIISSNTVLWIKKEGRKYLVKSHSDILQINKNLSILENELDQDFMSINRSTIVNLAFFKEYSFWENEKYIVRMMDGEAFNITRERLKVFKERLDSFHRKQ